MAYIGNYPAETQTVDLKWQPIKTASFTAVAGEGYWINTTSGAVTVTLPSSANTGDTIEFVDYARNWGTNAVTLNTNSLNFQGATTPNPVYDVDGQSVRIVYSGATQGWIPTSDDDVTFETPPSYDIEYLSVAGGGSGGRGTTGGGGGGAGGMLTGTLSNFNIGQTLTITVGAGGTAPTSGQTTGDDGDNSVISNATISDVTSIGGGGGGADQGSGANGRDGGSGGGGQYNGAGGSGTLGQGNDGGTGFASNEYPSGGGGGKGNVGGDAPNVSTAGNGGNGGTSSITGSSITYAGGGGGGMGGSSGTAGSGGTGGGGAGSDTSGVNGVSGTANTGGGGGGNFDANPGNGGSGVVILRVPTADYTGTTTGSPTVTTDGTDTVIKFTGSGSYTA